jgi:hypothetical protein
LIPWQCPHSMLLLCFTRFERMPGSKLDSLGVHIQRSYCVLHTLRGCQVTNLIPWECPHITFLLCFTRFERDAGYQTCCHGSAHIRRIYRVLRALTGCQVTNLIPWECPHSTFLLCFTCFEWMPLNKLDSLGVPTFNVSIVFYTL